MMSSQAVKSYYEGLVVLQDAIRCEENRVVAIGGFDCEENVIVPLATFIEWASSYCCREFALVFPTVEQAWSALDKAEAFMALSKPLIRIRDKRRRRFCIGNTWFTICSQRTKDSINIDLSGGIFVYRVDHPKISKLYSQIPKKRPYKIVTVKSANWLSHIPRLAVVEQKCVAHITTQFVDLSCGRYSSMFIDHEQRQQLERMRISGDLRGFRLIEDDTVFWFDDRLEGMYWLIKKCREGLT